MQNTKIEVAVKQANGLDTADDRRRPGRAEVAPELVGLLREPAAGSERDGEQDLAYSAGSDVLAPASGIVFGLMLVLPFWAAIIAAVYAFF